MSDPSIPWNGEQVRKWLDRRFEFSKLDQAAADRRGYDAQDEYDKAAAEEWVCRALKDAASTNEQATFAAHLKKPAGPGRIFGDGHLRQCAFPAAGSQSAKETGKDDKGE